MYCQQCGQQTEEVRHDGRLRPVCTSCGAVTYLDPKLAVAVVIAQDNCVLLGKRAGNTREPGKWSFPAGFVERGEVIEAAAIRETLEETGLTIEPGPLLRLVSSPGETVVLAVFPAMSFSGTEIPGDDLTQLRWWPLDELPALAFGHDRAIISLWQTSTAGHPKANAPKPE
jgi:ADP-ribose pyrophosphatase YjhB (NUDIX family)